MRQREVLRHIRGLFATALMVGFAPFANAAASATQPAAKALSECLGYYTVRLPGEVEYALMNDFPTGLGAWGSEIRLGLAGLEQQELSISPPAGMSELAARMDARNKEQQGEKDEFLNSAKWRTDHPDFSKINDPDGEKRRQDLLDAERVSFAQKISGRDAIFFPGKDKLALDALVNGHILSTGLKPQGTPEQTLDAFLSHYKPRALGEVPTGPGVCVPYGFFTGEKQPATVGLNIRLKDQPDIVIFLLATDAASDAPDDPEQFIANRTMPGRTFYQARGLPVPMRRSTPRETITIDGAAGLGTFLLVKRDDDPYPSPIDNAANHSIDWAFLAYVPGLRGGKPGQSFNLMFRVERFGRFAKHPMSEDEFRDLVMRIASSIKRRPGAWGPN